ncbi:hypothetical protein R6Q57_002801 [Mikania cordata]
MEILKTQDRFLSSRFVPDAFHNPYSAFALVWSDSNDNWRSLRSICRSEMFSAKALGSQSSLKEQKLTELIDFLCSTKGQVVNIGEVIFTTMFNNLSNIMFGKDFLDLKDEQTTSVDLRRRLLKMMKNGFAPNISDFYPILKRFDLQGLRKQTLKHVNDIFSSWEGIINERRLALVSQKEQCFVDRLIKNGFINDQIKLLALELFTAGTDTTTSTIEWVMAELIKNKQAMYKVQQELKQKLISTTNINVESEFSRLPYLNACIKEALRLHPPVPLLIPRRAVQTCEVMNYTVPRDAQILVNIWAIGRDPKLWDDPQLFKPERFLDSKVDFKGQDFEFIPFGAGRRMCPGLLLGVTSVQSILASLILQFEWVLPNGQDPVDLDMNEIFGLSLHMKKPLQLIFK